MKITLLLIFVTALFTGVTFGTQAKVWTKVESDAAVQVNQTPAEFSRLYLRAIAERLALEAKSAYWQGNYSLASQLFHLLLRSGCCDFNDIYNLACCYGKMGNDQQAARYLCLAVEAGFDDFEHISKDPDFEKLGKSPCFQKTVERLKREMNQKKNALPNVVADREPAQNDQADPAPAAGSTFALDN